MAPSRNFYEDDEVSSTTPGLNEQMSKELEKKESIQLSEDVSIFNGMTIRAPEFANKYLKDARLFLYKQLVLVENELSTTKTAINNEYADLKYQYHQMVEEPLLPNLIYILTGSLTGSIIVRNRLLPIRFITPLIFGTAVFALSMPKTFDNTLTLLSQYEQKWPELYETHRLVNALTRDYYQQSIDYKTKLDNDLVYQVGKARKYLTDLVNNGK